MGVTVELPPGCKGLDMKDGTRYTARRGGGRVQVSDEHACSLQEGQYGSTGLINAKGLIFLGTRRGRMCVPCGNRLWQAWSVLCPKCAEPTVEWEGRI
jgi:hypothetical protein